MVDFMKCKTDKLLPVENYHKHDLENVVALWKQKATNRYDTLKSEGRIRNELEVWTSGKDIQIIR